MKRGAVLSGGRGVPQVGQQEGGTYPTGMHSCYCLNLKPSQIKYIYINFNLKHNDKCKIPSKLIQLVTMRCVLSNCVAFMVKFIVGHRNWHRICHRVIGYTKRK